MRVVGSAVGQGDAGCPTVGKRENEPENLLLFDIMRIASYALQLYGYPARICGFSYFKKWVLRYGRTNAPRKNHPMQCEPIEIMMALMRVVVFG